MAKAGRDAFERLAAVGSDDAGAVARGLRQRVTSQGLRALAATAVHVAAAAPDDELVRRLAPERRLPAVDDMVAVVRGLEREQRVGVEPKVEPGQVLVQVEAVGLNFADIMTAQGGYPGTPKPPLVAGREFTGVEAGTGRRVMGYTQWAAFAETTAARPELLWKKQRNYLTDAGRRPPGAARSCGAASAKVPIFTGRLWWPSMRQPARLSGISRPPITITGITICLRRRS